MLGLRFATDCVPRTKNGQPAHSTVGTESTSSAQLCVPMAIQPSGWPTIASTGTMTVSGSVHQLQQVSVQPGLP